LIVEYAINEPTSYGYTIEYNLCNLAKVCRMSVSLQANHGPLLGVAPFGVPGVEFNFGNGSPLKPAIMKRAESL
jgi:hypothetical protein